MGPHTRDMHTLRGSLVQDDIIVMAIVSRYRGIIRVYLLVVTGVLFIRQVKEVGSNSGCGAGVMGSSSCDRLFPIPSLTLITTHTFTCNINNDITTTSWLFPN